MRNYWSKVGSSVLRERPWMSWKWKSMSEAMRLSGIIACSSHPRSTQGLAVRVYSRNMVKNCRGFRSWPPQDVRILFCLANTRWLNAGSVPKESTMRNRQLQRGIPLCCNVQIYQSKEWPACTHTFSLFLPLPLSVCFFGIFVRRRRKKNVKQE